MNDKTKNILKYTIAGIVIAILYIAGTNFDYTKFTDYLILALGITVLFSWWNIIVCAAEDGWIFLFFSCLFFPYLIWYGFFRNNKKAMMPTIIFCFALFVGTLIKSLFLLSSR